MTPNYSFARPKGLNSRREVWWVVDDATRDKTWARACENCSMQNPALHFCENGNKWNDVAPKLPMRFAACLAGKNDLCAPRSPRKTNLWHACDLEHLKSLDFKIKIKNIQAPSPVRDSMKIWILHSIVRCWPQPAGKPLLFISSLLSFPLHFHALLAFLCFELQISQAAEWKTPLALRCSSKTSYYHNMLLQKCFHIRGVIYDFLTAIFPSNSLSWE